MVNVNFLILLKSKLIFLFLGNGCKLMLGGRGGSLLYEMVG